MHVTWSALYAAAIMGVLLVPFVMAYVALKRTWPNRWWFVRLLAPGLRMIMIDLGLIAAAAVVAGFVHQVPFASYVPAIDMAQFVLGIGAIYFLASVGIAAHHEVKLRSVASNVPHEDRAVYQTILAVVGIPALCLGLFCAAAFILTFF